MAHGGLSHFVAPLYVAPSTTPGDAKPTSEFLGFKHIAHVARKTKNNTISLLKPVEQTSPQKSCSEIVLERAGLYLRGV